MSSISGCNTMIVVYVVVLSHASLAMITHSAVSYSPLLGSSVVMILVLVFLFFFLFLLYVLPFLRIFSLFFFSYLRW